MTKVFIVIIFKKTLLTINDNNNNNNNNNCHYLFFIFLLCKVCRPSCTGLQPLGRSAEPRAVLHPACRSANLRERFCRPQAHKSADPLAWVCSHTMPHQTNLLFFIAGSAVWRLGSTALLCPTKYSQFTETQSTVKHSNLFKL